MTERTATASQAGGTRARGAGDDAAAGFERLYRANVEAVTSYFARRSADQKSGIAPANARLRRPDGKQVVVVPVEAGCPKPPPPAVPVHGVRISVRSGVSRDGSVTVNAQGIPAGDILVIGVRADGHSRAGIGIVTSPPAPDCVSAPAALPGHGGSGR